MHPCIFTESKEAAPNSIGASLRLKGLLSLSAKLNEMDMTVFEVKHNGSDAEPELM